MSTDNHFPLARVSGVTIRIISSRLQALAPVPVAALVEQEYPEAEVARLLGAVLQHTADKACPVVHFLSAYNNEGSGGIAFETALAAARFAGRRTLFLNLNTTPTPAYQPLSSRVRISVQGFCTQDAPTASPLVSLSGLPLYYAEFSERAGDIAAVASLDLVRNLLTELREGFDLIVIASEAAAQGSSALLGGLVDGTIMVVEAERTRAPVAEQIRQQIEEAGGKLIGTVLNRRRFHIPRWVYRLLFGGHH